MNRKISTVGRRAVKSSLGLLSPFLNLRSRATVNDKVMILVYHRVVADVAETEKEAIPGLLTSIETFGRHLEILSENCDICSLDFAAERLSGKRRTSRTVAVITFDDGYRDIYENALPILRRFGFPATVFLPAAYIGTGRRLSHDRLFWLVHKAFRHRLSLHAPLIRAGLPWSLVSKLCTIRDASIAAEQLVYLPSSLRDRLLDGLNDFLDERDDEYPTGYQLLDWKMINQMAHAGIDFGAHTSGHPVLTLETEEIIRRDIVEGKRRIEEMLGREVRHFAYPNGRYNEKVKAIVYDAGFELALTCDRRINQRGDDLLALGRIGLCEESTRGVTGRYSETVARLRLSP